MTSERAHQESLRRELRHHLANLRKQIQFVDELVGNARRMSLDGASQWEVRSQLRLCFALTKELARQFDELTHGYGIEDPTVEEVRRLFEARRRLSSHLPRK